ncbi:MAG: helix-turn-helix domain-containing protein [Myxococcales bacterium]|nr:helix-turn-helix domain-containing protein [Myxococcales bacterium]
MVALVAGGATQRDAAARLGVSQATVRRTLARADAEGGPVLRRRRQDPRARPKAPHGGGAQAPGAGAAPFDAPGAARDEALARLRLRLAEAGELGAAARKSGNVSAWAATTRAEREIVQAIAALEGPPPLDPALDPANHEARDAMTERLRVMVEDGRARAEAQGCTHACPRCCTRMAGRATPPPPAPTGAP